MEAKEYPTTVPRGVIERSVSARYGATSESEYSQSDIESLLLRMRLGGKMAQSDEVLLHSLADERSVLFLHYEGCTNQAGEFENLTCEAVGLALRSGNSAIFSHRFSSPDSAHQNSYRIQTATLHPQATKPIVLGMISPDSGYSDHRTDRVYPHLLSIFQKAACDIEQSATRIESKIQGQTAIIVVNRASGRILAANDAASDLLGKTSPVITGLEFGELKRRMASRLARTAISMENIECGSLRLAIVSVRDIRTEATDGRPTLNHHMVHQMRNALTAITSAATTMNELSQTRDQAAESKLSGIIVAESKRLDDDLCRWSLILDGKSLPSQEVDVDSELDRAVAMVRAAIGPSARVVIEKVSGPYKSMYPGKALMFLFEAALMAHFKSDPTPERAVIHRSYEKETRTLKVQVESHLKVPVAERNLEARWSEIFTRMAAEMSVKISSRVNDDRSGLSTTLEIPVNN